MSTLPPTAAAIGTTPISFGRGTLRVAKRHDSIVLVALNSPRTLNAFSDNMYQDLIDIMHYVKADDTLAAIVWTGTGRFFSSGADISESFTQSKVFGKQPRVTETLSAGRFMMELIHFPKIMAAAVNGPTVGIGTTALMHCDLVFCSHQATFWAPFSRLALVPELCSSVLFVESHGLAKANELLLLGSKLTAQQALEYNLCSRVLRIHHDNPFDDASLGSYLCDELHRQLLSLPLGKETARVFCHFVKHRRRNRLTETCRQELKVLDERFNSGQVQEAVSQLSIGKRKHKRGSKVRSKL